MELEPDLGPTWGRQVSCATGALCDHQVFHKHDVAHIQGLQARELQESWLQQQQQLLWMELGFDCTFAEHVTP